jgi:hypothetical protein
VVATNIMGQISMTLCLLLSLSHLVSELFSSCSSSFTLVQSFSFFLSLSLALFARIAAFLIAIDAEKLRRCKGPVVLRTFNS